MRGVQALACWPAKACVARGRPPAALCCARQVAGLVSVLDKDLADRVRTAELDLGPLLPGSYASLLAAELGRKLRRGVSVAFYPEPPAGLFDARLLGDDLAGWELAPAAAGGEQQ